MARLSRFTRRGTATTRTRRVGRAVLALALPAVSLVAVTAVGAPPANADTTNDSYNGLADKPYMGWSSWSLESTNYPGVNPNGPASWLTEAHVVEQADVLAAEFKQHGYKYVNVDAGWLGGYDSNALPTVKASTFPHGLKWLADYVHGKGLRFGTYIAVGLDPLAYNNGDNPIAGAPECHTRDLVYPDLRKTNGWDSNYKIDYSNPCGQKYANSIARLFASWKVDFLKMDGVGPGSSKGGANYDNTADVAAWAKALKDSGRRIEYILSWSLSHKEAATWKKYSNGWRIDTDVECYCDTLVTWNNSVKQRWNDVVQWIDDAGPGHWNNLDSLVVGSGKMDGITEDERQSKMTLWAISASPLYMGDDLTKLDDFGRKLLKNDEVIRVDQQGNPAKPVSQTSGRQVWYAKNADGSYTVALFNLDGAPATVTADWADLGITGRARVRDLWKRANIGDATGSFSAELPSHGSRLLRITPREKSGPSIPLSVHGTDSTSSSISLAWDAATVKSGRITGYDVYDGTAKVASVPGTTATVSGLQPGTGHQFTVVSKDDRGGRSPASKPLALTTPAAGGPKAYEAEASNNTLGGGAQIYDCNCSGGKKVGYVGGSGYVTINDVTAPVDGTYLVKVAYVDGDSSRTAVVTVNDTSFNLPLAGTNDNDWNSTQTVTIPIRLKAGTNTVKFGNPSDYVSDFDKITV